MIWYEREYNPDDVFVCGKCGLVDSHTLAYGKGEVVNDCPNGCKLHYKKKCNSCGHHYQKLVEKQ